MEMDNRVTCDSSEDVYSLCFRSTVLDDEGEYKCKAQNNLGSATCTLELLVNEIDVCEPQTKPEFLEKVKDVNAFEGDSASFSVKVQGNPKPEVQWFSADKEITTRDRFVVEPLGDGVYTLTIDDCDTKDKGRYKCVASNVVGKAVCSGTLVVKEKLIPPYFSEQASEVPVQIDEGGDINVEAEVKGNPKPSVKWYKDDKPISRTSSKYRTEVEGDKHVLTIVGASPEDAGTYRCKATSPAGTATRDFNVNIDGEFLLYCSSTRGHAKFKCLHGLFEYTRSSNRIPSFYILIFYFLRQITLFVRPDLSRKLLDQSKREFCLFSRLDLAYLMLTYFTLLSIAAKQHEGEAPKFIQPLKSQEVMEGSPAKLDVRISGEPEPEVEWFKDEQPVEEGSNFRIEFDDTDGCSLIINSSRVEDEGQYKCVASNDLGKAISEAELLVTGMKF